MDQIFPESAVLVNIGKSDFQEFENSYYKLWQKFMTKCNSYYKVRCKTPIKLQNCKTWFIKLERNYVCLFAFSITFLHLVKL